MVRTPKNTKPKEFTPIGVKKIEPVPLAHSGLAYFSLGLTFRKITKSQKVRWVDSGSMYDTVLVRVRWVILEYSVHERERAELQL